MKRKGERFERVEVQQKGPCVVGRTLTNGGADDKPCPSVPSFWRFFALDANRELNRYPSQIRHEVATTLAANSVGLVLASALR